ncbi:MAG: S16 family serine protease [Actinomycetota bacterium]
MSRRVRTLLVGGIAFVVLFLVAMLVPVPYVILSPGPTLNTLGADASGAQIIVIKGRDTNKTTGNLNLTTVGISRQRVTAFQALRGWLQTDRVVVPRYSIYPPGQSQEQVDKADTEQFVDSQSSASAAAFCELGYPKGLGVVGVLDHTGAKDVLRPFDQLISVDAQPASSQDVLAAILATRTPGERASVVIVRLGERKTVSVTLSDPASGAKGARLGITVGVECFAPFEVDLGLADQIGGPSAGLMFALGIIEKVGPTDLTKGKFIAGTGAITPEGVVRPIGGIALKMVAARRAGASVFLAPQDNCADVRGTIPGGLDVIKIGSLHDAVTDLAAYNDGKAVPHC